MDTQRFPLSYYKKELVFKVGVVGNPKERANYFLNFPLEKRKKVTRIGTFGGSWVYGDEVTKGQSYPAQLMELFNQHFTETTVEVLNFGVNGYGLPQSFLLWEEYAEKYNLDYILLGLFGFFDPKRGLVFRNPWLRFNLEKLEPPRGRYILKKTKSDYTLSFVNIKGEDFLTRYRNCYSLFPSWKILKYDRYFFNFWKSSYSLTENPFYYSKLSAEEESFKINKMLLNKIKMSSLSPQILLLDISFRTPWPNTHMYEEEKKTYNFNKIVLFERGDFLYRRKAHLSSLGNEMTATVYFNALKSTKNFVLKIFRCYEKIKRKGAHLNSVAKIGNKNISPFLKNSSRNIKIEKVNLVHDNLKIGELQSLKNRFDIPIGTKSLIGFFGADDLSMQGVFVPLPFQLNGTSRIFIRAKRGKKISLGHVFPLDERGFFYGFQKDYIFTKVFKMYGNERLKLKLPIHIVSLLFSNALKSANKNSEFALPARSSLSLWVQNYKIADLEQDHNNKKKLKNDFFILFVNWVKSKESFIFIGPDHYLRHSSMPEMMDRIFLQYVTNKNKTFLSLIPGLYCKKEKTLIHLDLPNLKFL